MKIKQSPADNPAEARWWRMPIWWMVLGGPLVVVVASFVTLYIAVDGADPVLPTYGKSDRSALPAREGRNLANVPEPEQREAAPER
jgi:uncharacterized protein